MNYEFHIYKGDEFGRIAETAEVIVKRVSGDGAAKARAGRMAKSANGPVDLARSGKGEWTSRYITTACPSEFHSSGFRFERLT
jgi:hypothetical protein